MLYNCLNSILLIYAVRQNKYKFNFQEGIHKLGLKKSFMMTSVLISGVFFFGIFVYEFSLQLSLTSIKFYKKD